MFALRPAGGPIWKQIEETIRRVVAGRHLRPGDPVPSVRQLARTLSVTPNTVERAYQRLIAAGVLLSRRGRGTFVAGIAEAESSPRDHLLQDAAMRFAATASAVGAPLDEAVNELAAAYRRLDDASVLSQ
ncbi:MAG TPA: GntR family transcriptional regulator [Thermoanaerobaculia bacterium]|nr:GntR family transcriptional regulator [Thermoanaerobaculia bacterium]